MMTTAFRSTSGRSGPLRSVSGRRSSWNGPSHSTYLALPSFCCFLLPAVAGLILSSAWAPGADNPSLARPPKFSELFGDDVLARGKGVEVRQSHLDQAYVSLKATLSARGQDIPEGNRIRQEAQLLERLIVTQLLTNRVTAPDRTNAQALAEKYLTDTQKGLSDESFQRHLKALGLTMDQFSARVREQSLADAVLQRELRSRLTVTDAQVQDFYANGNDVLVRAMQADLDKLVKDPASSSQQVAEFKQRIDEVRKANLARLDQPERVKVAHVFMATRDRQTEQELSPETKSEKRRQLERIRERALAGEEFTKLVMDFSEDRGVKDTRGEYTFGREAPFAEEFKAASFSLQPGKISDIVTTLYGYHVIKLLERLPPQKIELEKASGDLKDFLLQQEVIKAMPDYFAGLKKGAGVEILSAKHRIMLQEMQKPR
jgi:parvulin-like peptidyl-prolyl isomerase